VSGETEKEISAWTIDSLREHYDVLLAQLDRRYEQRFEAQEKAVDAALASAEKAVSAALAAQEKAVDKAERADEKRFESVNEFRAQLSDQAGSFLPRAEADVRFTSINEKIAGNTARFLTVAALAVSIMVAAVVLANVLTGS
jgi:hypothetical protein